MKGQVRTEQKCPQCSSNYIQTEHSIYCRNCPTSPTKFLIDLYHNRRIRIYKDESGQILDSYERASRLLTHIRWEIDNHKFDPAKYIRTKHEPYHMNKFSKNWIKEQELRSKTQEIAYSTYHKYLRIIETYIAPYFGRQDIREIRTRDVKDFNTQLARLKTRKKQPLSPKYRQDILGTLRQMFNDALASEDITRSQVPVFPKIEIPQKGFDVLTEREQDEILQKIDCHDRPIYHFILWYGVRPSEARALKRDAVIGDFDQILIRRTFTRNNRIRENPKEGRWRAISLLEETKQILIGLTPSFNGYVFINKWGRPYSQDYLNATWNEACREASYRYIRLYHAARHSLGTKLANQGLGKDIIASVLGHTSTKTTEKYVRYASDALRPFYERKKTRKAIVGELPVARNREQRK